MGQGGVDLVVEQCVLLEELGVLLLFGLVHKGEGVEGLPRAEAVQGACYLSSQKHNAILI